MATGIVLAALAAGCERPSEGKAGRCRPARESVEVVHPERHTIRRSVGEPGELQAFETTAIHARIPGYVKNWTVNIGAAVKKGQVLAELSVPELEAEVRQKQAAVEQAVAKHKQAGAAVRVAEANVAGAEAKLVEVRAGKRRVEADLARWQAEFHRVEQLHRGTGTDRQPARRDPEQAPLLRGRPRRRSQAQVKTAEVAVTRARPRSIQPIPTSTPRPPPSRSPRRTPAPSRRCSATPGSRPPSTASSPSGTSTPAT